MGQGAVRQYYIYWYLVTDMVVVDPIAVKYRELQQRLMGHAASGIVAIRIECRSDCQNKLAGAIEFLKAHGAAINDELFGWLSKSDEILAEE